MANGAKASLIALIDKQIGEIKNVLNGYSSRESNQGNQNRFSGGALCSSVAQTDKVEISRAASCKTRGFFVFRGSCSVGRSLIIEYFCRGGRVFKAFGSYPKDRELNSLPRHHFIAGQPVAMLERVHTPLSQRSCDYVGLTPTSAISLILRGDVKLT